MCHFHSVSITLAANNWPLKANCPMIFCVNAFCWMTHCYLATTVLTTLKGLLVLKICAVRPSFLAATTALSSVGYVPVVPVAVVNTSNIMLPPSIPFYEMTVQAE
jgi:hypothetical protein